MKKIFGIAALTAMMFAGTACSSAQKSNEDSASAKTADADSKVLVAYYSATGNTEKAAERVADATGGTLYRIEPVEPYTDEDLDYENKDSRSSKENADRSIRPEIKKGLDIAGYETVYLGFPVWWDKAPLVVNTFLDSYDFSGKKIIVFGTAHSSGLTPSYDTLKADFPQYNFEEGGILNVQGAKTFNEWLEGLKK
ncbi:MAG: flavodoxin [Muribaculaceae bacterium]|nr:flavodoxin [Muribaculaceae bacterium]MDE6558610.1 flavodoxin [Muribaculaceae bacterium]